MSCKTRHKSRIEERPADVWRPLHCLNQLIHLQVLIECLAEALHKLDNEVGHESGAAFVRPSALTEPPGAYQSDCTGVGVGVGVTVADGSGEGDSPAVEKFRPRGVGAGMMNWR